MDTEYDLSGNNPDRPPTTLEKDPVFILTSPPPPPPGSFNTTPSNPSGGSLSYSQSYFITEVDPATGKVTNRQVTYAEFSRLTGGGLSF